MTKMFEKAVAKAKRLPDEQQDSIASLILEEIEDEKLWDGAFARSHDVLERLALEAEEEDSNGLTEEFDPEKL
ncbi:MAG: hypothetical protein ACRENO_05635 [Thermodesulfobacteriota bacterium]